MGMPHALSSFHPIAILLFDKIHPPSSSNVTYMMLVLRIDKDEMIKSFIHRCISYKYNDNGIYCELLLCVVY